MDPNQPRPDDGRSTEATIVDLGDNAAFAMARVGGTRRLPLVVAGAIAALGVLVGLGLLGSDNRPATSPVPTLVAARPTTDPAATPALLQGGETPTAFVWGESAIDELGDEGRLATQLPQRGVWALRGGYVAVVAGTSEGTTPGLAMAGSVSGRRWGLLNLPFGGGVDAVAEWQGQLLVIASQIDDAGVETLDAWRTPDGSTWERLGPLTGMPGHPARVVRLAAGPTGWVAVLASPIPGTESQLESASLWRSRDGVAWLPVDVPELETIGRIEGLVGNSSRWLLLARRDAPIEGSVSTILASTDGRHWTASAMVTMLGGPAALAAGPKGFAAVGDRESSSARAGVWVSEDGLVWRDQPIRMTEPAVPYGLNAIAPWGDGWVAASSSGDAVASADGRTWLLLHVLADRSYVEIRALGTFGDLVAAVGVNEDGGQRFWSGSLRPFVP